MKKTFLTSVAVLFLATGIAHAQKPVTIVPLYSIFPPIKYDYDYEGDLTIEIVETQAEVQTFSRMFLAQREKLPDPHGAR